MKNVSNLLVAQLRVYPQDTFPRSMRSRAFTEALKERFSFGVTGIVEESEDLGGAAGTWKDSAGTTVTIEHVQISTRRILCSVLGSSTQASEFNSALVVFLSEQLGIPSLPDPVIKTETTTCSATLDFDCLDLLAPALTAFLNSQVVPVLTTEQVVPELARLNLSFTYRFEATDRAIVGSGIPLAEKVLRVEPRANTPLSERRYFTSSPTDSDTHLRLLKELERSLGRERKTKNTAAPT